MIQNPLWGFNSLLHESHQGERVLYNQPDEPFAVENKLVPRRVFVPNKRVQTPNLGSCWQEPDRFWHRLPGMVRCLGQLFAQLEPALKNNKNKWHFPDG